MSEVIRILSALGQGDPQAASQLLPLVYDELRQLAGQRLAQEKPGQTLQPTALVHEAYLRLVDGERRGSSPPWNGRGHFFAAAAEAMRRILVENARRKQCQKRGGGRVREGDGSDVPGPDRPEALLALDKALDRLVKANPQATELVKLRYFAGLTGEQAAAVLGLSASSADRQWVFTRAWLRRELGFGIEP